MLRRLWLTAILLCWLVRLPAQDNRLFNSLEGTIGQHARNPAGFVSAHLAVRKRPSRGRPGEPGPPPTTVHLQTQEKASAISWARPLVLDRAVRGVEGLAETSVRGTPGHGGALAAGAFPQILGAPVEEVGKARSASDQPSGPRVDSDHGLRQSFVAWAAHSRRVAEAGNRGVGTDRFPRIADRETAAVTDLENFLTESHWGDRRHRLLHCTDDPPAGTGCEAILGPRPRCHLWQRVSASNSVIGHEGGHQRAPESLAECIRGAHDRLDST